MKKVNQKYSNIVIFNIWYFEYLLGQNGVQETTRIHNAEGYFENGEYFYFRKDHLGNNREVWNATQNTTVQKNDYYASGLPFVYTTPQEQPYMYNGKEFVEFGGYDVTDLGNRGDYHAINRFTSMDRFCEKFPHQSPYVVAGNNMIRFVDNNGDSIIVPLKYQENFNSALSSIFGEHASNFSYDDNGILSFNGDVDNLSKDQRYVFDKMNGLMKSETNTTIIYEKKYTVTDNEGKKTTINTNKFGGEGTVSKVENPKLDGNYVVVNPKMATSFTVDAITSDFYNLVGKVVAKEKRFTETVVKTNANNATWHGLGHVIFAGQSQDKVIEFDNLTRQMSNPPLEPRKEDVNHNKNKK